MVTPVVAVVVEYVVLYGSRLPRLTFISLCSSRLVATVTRAAAAAATVRLVVTYARSLTRVIQRSDSLFFQLEARRHGSGSRDRRSPVRYQRAFASAFFLTQLNSSKLAAMAQVAGTVVQYVVSSMFAYVYD